jgi:leader peptidase (prepilin peptidase) / N-methyltransferase
VSGAEVAGAVLAVGVGASIGSFLGVVIERVPRGESLGGRSHCVCGAPIRALDNVPVISYLVRRGRARCCGASIPAWYLAIEAGGAVVALAGYLLVIS